MKLKNYKISSNIHVYQQKELYIAYDVNTGSLHLLDQKTYRLIREIETLQTENPELLAKGELLLAKTGSWLEKTEKEEILDELGQLQDEGTLFSPEAEKYEIRYPEEPLIKAICLHVAHDCNLRCTYCFAGTGAFGGGRRMMDLETGKKAIDFILEHSGSRPHCEVDFFGGEPLMNFEVVKELVTYGKKAAKEKGKKIKFTLTTNAVLLDQEIRTFLEREEISAVLSLDGRKEVNDRARPFPGGRGSYDRIVPRIREFIERRPEASPYAIGTYYYVRGTFTHFNTDFHKDVIHLADLGIDRISLEPVVAEPDKEYAFQEEDMDRINEAYDVLGETVLAYKQQGKNFNFFHFNAGLDAGPCLPKRLSGCGAGYEYAAISPEGDIYPCHQFVGQPAYKMGSLQERGSLNRDIVDSFRKANIYAKPECMNCWARYSCSGGCHASNTAYSGSLNEVYPLGCRLQRKRLEVAYYLKVREKIDHKFPNEMRNNLDQ
nr:thioether cross-link-forming SCIFF peptide maturase [Syntrophobotulus glycolicus]